MNLYIFALLESLIQDKLSAFAILNIIKSAAYLSDLKELSDKMSSLADVYLHFLQKIEFLPADSFKRDLFGSFDLKDEHLETGIDKILKKITRGKIQLSEAVPVNLHYTEDKLVHFVGGLVQFEREDFGFIFLIDLCIPKADMNIVPPNTRYVIEIIESYNSGEKISLRQLVSSRGLNYNQFQKDCKTCFGDTFYSFSLKLKLMEAFADIVFNALSLKEIAFKNGFRDYGNMYKTFVRYGINPTQIPRLANL